MRGYKQCAMRGLKSNMDNIKYRTCETLISELKTDVGYN